MSDIRSTNLRFNLSKPSHQKAWKYLQTMDRSIFKSYTSAVIAALNDYFDRLYNQNDEINEQLAKNIAAEVSVQLKTILSEVPAASVNVINNENMFSEETDIDWDFIGKG